MLGHRMKRDHRIIVSVRADQDFYHFIISSNAEYHIVGLNTPTSIDNLALAWTARYNATHSEPKIIDPAKRYRGKTLLEMATAARANGQDISDDLIAAVQN